MATTPLKKRPLPKWRTVQVYKILTINKSIVSYLRCTDEGYTTFDLADIYGPAEDYVGQFRKGVLKSSMAKECQFFTKWVPQPETLTREMVSTAIGRSLRRMQTEKLDLVQFHWWDYNNKYYYDGVHYLMDLQQKGQIENIGLCNFDTKHMEDLLDEGAPIVSNQVALSVIDTRPLQKMTAVALKHNVKLLCYGTLMGGFLSSRWKGQPEPPLESLSNVSLRKYLPWIRYWGGWQLFQEMLTVLDVVAMKHGVTISTVALRWALDQPGVGGAIVGVRLGLREHLRENKRVFSFTLDESDRAAIAAVQTKSKDLMGVFGDCGGEYRRRPRA